MALPAVRRTATPRVARSRHLLRMKTKMRTADKISIWAFVIVMSALFVMMMYGHHPP